MAPITSTEKPIRLIVLTGESVFGLHTSNIYPMWAMVLLTLGIVFCTLSCGVWFICAIFRLREEKECKHPVYESKIVVNAENGEQGLKSEKTKHSKKVEALSEAESLAKSFKSIKSKKSSKSSKKSSKSSKEAAASVASSKTSKKSSKTSKKSSKTSKKSTKSSSKEPEAAPSPAVEENGGSVEPVAPNPNRSDAGREDPFVIRMSCGVDDVQDSNNGFLKHIARFFSRG